MSENSSKKSPQQTFPLNAGSSYEELLSAYGCNELAVYSRDVLCVDVDEIVNRINHIFGPGVLRDEQVQIISYEGKELFRADTKYTITTTLGSNKSLERTVTEDFDPFNCSTDDFINAFSCFATVQRADGSVVSMPDVYRPYNVGVSIAYNSKLYDFVADLIATCLNEQQQWYLMLRESFVIDYEYAVNKEALMKRFGNSPDKIDQLMQQLINKAIGYLSRVYTALEGEIERSNDQRSGWGIYKVHVIREKLFAIHLGDARVLDFEFGRIK